MTDADFGFRDEVAFDMRLGAETPHASAIAHLLHVVIDRIAGHDGTAEPRFVDGHEIDERGFLELLDMAHAKSAGGLRHAFDEEHAGHHWIAGEVSLEIRFIGRTFLMPVAERSHPVDDAVDHEKRITMREKLRMSVISAFPSFDFTPLSFINNRSLDRRRGMAIRPSRFHLRPDQASNPYVRQAFATA